MALGILFCEYVILSFFWKPARKWEFFVLLILLGVASFAISERIGRERYARVSEKIIGPCMCDTLSDPVSSEY